MTRVATAVVWNLLPPRWAVASMVVGLLAFALTLATGLAVTILILLAIPPQVPHPTEAYEGFGDAVTALLRLILGASVSILVALIAGISSGIWVAKWDLPRDPALPNTI